MNKEDRYGKEYFDSEKDEPGKYARYSPDCLMPYFISLASFLISSHKPRTALDVGCAKGFFVLALREFGVETWGVDISEYAIAQASEQVRPWLLKVDIEENRLPFDDNRFDMVTMLGVLAYLGDHQQPLKEIRRVLRSGGLLVVTTVFRVSRSDKIRKNIHVRDFWIREIESYGFEHIIDSGASKFFDKLNLEHRLREANSLIIRVGRIIYRLPMGGEWLLTQHSKRRIGILLFQAL